MCGQWSRTEPPRWDLGEVGPEAGEVLLLAGDEEEQQHVSRGDEGERLVRVPTLPEEEPQDHLSKQQHLQLNMNELLHLYLFS